MTDQEAFRCGYIAIIGRPNVGKSTLLNRILGQKLSITSHRPQTTRHRIAGIKTGEHFQAIYVDTPGIHRQTPRAINRYMNRTAAGSLDGVDMVLFVVDGTRWTEDDEQVLQLLKNVVVPVVLVVNKVDKIDGKEVLLPYLAEISQRYPFREVVPVAAKNGDGVPALERCVISLLPIAPAVFEDDQITDRSERFVAAELVREKLMRNLGQELPYALTVEIERFVVENDVRRIAALIWVERPGQKAIVIGSNGQTLKRVGEQARKDMERIFDGKVFLELWVKVKQGWADDERALRSLGYGDEQ